MTLSGKNVNFRILFSCFDTVWAMSSPWLFWSADHQKRPIGHPKISTFSTTTTGQCIRQLYFKWKEER